ncbi:MAG TPA: FtsX-like permease family protein [Bryobacteraceae bacterium]|nr:FtsX-like permease family protein [Bryobacteraceae bacterium]
MRLPRGPFVKKIGLVEDHPTVALSPRVNVLLEQIQARIAGIPAVKSVSAGVHAPLSQSTLGGLAVNFTIEGRRADGTGRQISSAAWFPVSARYFRTLGIPLIRGREFGAQDAAGTLPVVLINQTIARRFWPGDNAIGKRVRIDLVNEPIREIVGVVGDVRHDRYEREAKPEMYLPYAQLPLVSEDPWVDSRLSMTFVVRSELESLPLVPSLRAAVAEVDHNLPIFNIKTLDAYVAEQLWQAHQTMILLAVFSAIAVVLAATGVYGIIAYAVRQRTYEIGIRMALGASRKNVLQMLLALGLALVAAGVVIGAAGAVALTRFLRSLLWGVTPADTLTYAAAIVTVIVVAMVAWYLPARRALEIELTVALRCE